MNRVTEEDQYEEELCIFNDFPLYEVSSTGRVFNRNTGREVRPSLTQAGQVKVGLIHISGSRKTVLVKQLVAEAFVEGQTELFNTVINLDGDQNNNHFSNLVWRPRWFALQWARQNTRISEGKKPQYFVGEVLDLDTREVYDHTVDASKHTGSAPSEIFSSCMMQNTTWPDIKRYRWVIDSRLGEIGTPDEYEQINFDYRNLRMLK